MEEEKVESEVTASEPASEVAPETMTSTEAPAVDESTL